MAVNAAVQPYALTSGWQNCLYVPFVDHTCRTQYLCVRWTPCKPQCNTHNATKIHTNPCIHEKYSSALHKQLLQSWVHCDLTCRSLVDGRLNVGRSPPNERIEAYLDSRYCGWERPFWLAALNNTPSQWLGWLFMGLRSLVSGWYAVPNFTRTSWNAHSVLGPKKDRQLLTLDFVRLGVYKIRYGWVRPKDYCPFQWDTRNVQTHDGHRELPNLPYNKLFVHIYSWL